jgi:hypothetical protein
MMASKEDLIEEAVALFKSSEELLYGVKSRKLKADAALVLMMNAQLELTRALFLLTLAEVQKK